MCDPRGSEREDRVGRGQFQAVGMKWCLRMNWKFKGSIYDQLVCTDLWKG